MDGMTVTLLRTQLCATAGFAGEPKREPISTCSLSAVERLRFSDGSTVIFKVVAEPFAGEEGARMLAAAQGVPVAERYASLMIGGVLGMLLHLGEPIREAENDDGVRAAVLLHQIRPAGLQPPTLDTGELRLLPSRALVHLDSLREGRRWRSTSDIAEMLAALDKVAPVRAQGAELEPFGLCHGEFHPVSLHIGTAGWRLLDLARAFNGPGLLDLASWLGTQRPASTARLRRLIEAYVAGGGPQDALAERGGLPAETWALGWHRAWTVEWLMGQARHWINDAGTDRLYIKDVRRHLREAIRLLAPAQA
ncbi:hypothetical protein [Planotetraspora sp. GP83]|uniref:hypothetical protein n=1 Tax=Planotetraspora sp. GP83 TaxID=3156264 RepID=UPI003511ADE7